MRSGSGRRGTRTGSGRWLHTVWKIALERIKAALELINRAASVGGHSHY